MSNDICTNKPLRTLDTLLKATAPVKLPNSYYPSFKSMLVLEIYYKLEEWSLTRYLQVLTTPAFACTKAQLITT